MCPPNSAPQKGKNRDPKPNLKEETMQALTQMVQKVVYAWAWTGHYLAFKKIEHALNDVHFGTDVDHFI